MAMLKPSLMGTLVMIIHKERQSLTSATINFVSVIMKYLGADLCCDQGLVTLQGRADPFFSTQTC